MSNPFDARGITATGSSVFAIVEAVKAFSVLVNVLLEVMKVQTRDATGALTVDPNAWYPIEDTLLAHKKVDSLLGGRGLEKVGSFIPQHAVFPPDIDNIHSALRSIDIAYHMNHRKDGEPMFNPATGALLEGIGHYGFKLVEGKREIVMVCDNPYPCRFDLGIIKGMAHRFEPRATVTHDTSTACRQKGAATCTYVVTW
jgi:hypothetical protein